MDWLDKIYHHAHTHHLQWKPIAHPSQPILKMSNIRRQMKRAARDPISSTPKRRKPAGGVPLSSQAEPRLCPIYLRDVLSFFTRDELEEARLVSSAVDTTIQHAFATLARMKYHSLAVYTVRALFF